MNGEEININNQYYSNNNIKQLSNSQNIEEEEEIQSEENPNYDQQEYIYEENENNEDDNYIIELQKKFALMKHERKVSENDGKLLNNRLRLLKNEEEKVKFPIFLFSDLEKNNEHEE